MIANLVRKDLSLSASRRNLFVSPRSVANSTGWSAAAAMPRLARRRSTSCARCPTDQQDLTAQLNGPAAPAPESAPSPAPPSSGPDEGDERGKRNRFMYDLTLSALPSTAERIEHRADGSVRHMTETPEQIMVVARVAKFRSALINTLFLVPDPAPWRISSIHGRPNSGRVWLRLLGGHDPPGC